MFTAAAYLHHTGAFCIAAVFAAIVILARDLTIAVLVFAFSGFLSHTKNPSLDKEENKFDGGMRLASMLGLWYA